MSSGAELGRRAGINVHQQLQGWAAPCTRPAPAPSQAAQSRGDSQAVGPASLCACDAGALRRLGTGFPGAAGKAGGGGGSPLGQ